MVELIKVTPENLNPAAAADRGHKLIVMIDGVVYRLDVGQVADLVKAELAGSSPATLDTIEEIAAALQGNPDFYQALTDAIALKANAADTIISGLTAKTAPVDADVFRIGDSAASFAHKKVSWANLKIGLGKGFLQAVSSFTGAVATGTTLIPDDNTIPQSTEGTEFLSVAITPGSASNILEIDAKLIMAVGNGGGTCLALFQNGVSNALTADRPIPGGTGYTQAGTLRWRMAAGTTSPITFSVRAGPLVATTMTINGSAGAGKFNGVMNSYLEVKEYAS